MPKSHVMIWVRAQNVLCVFYTYSICYFSFILAQFGNTFTLLKNLRK